jgi:hypothetical protein
VITELKGGSLLAGKNTLSVFNYGPNGSGKTNMISTCPKPYSIFTEKAAAGLELRGFKVDGAVVKTFADLEQVTQEILQGKRAVGYETICLDSISEVTDLVIPHVLNGKTMPTNQGEWYHVKEKLKRYVIHDLIDGVDTIKKNLYVTARANIREDEVGGGIQGIPDTIGQFAFVIRGLFDVCGYSEQKAVSVKGNIDYIWEFHTIAYGKFFAKDTLGFCDPIEYYSELKGPSFKKMLEKFQAKKALVLAANAVTGEVK